MCKRTNTFQSCKLVTNSTISGQNCENTKLFKLCLLVVHIEVLISHNSMFRLQMTRIVVVGGQIWSTQASGSNNMSICYSFSLVPGLRARQHFTERVHQLITPTVLHWEFSDVIAVTLQQPFGITFCTPKVENAHVTCGIKLLQVKLISSF